MNDDFAVEHPESDLPRAMGTPARRALALAGYTRLEQLQGVSERMLAGLHGVGPRGLQVLKQAMAERGLALGA